jgi:hypothetical protein
MKGNANRARILYHLAQADFLERVRRYNFLVTLGFALYFGYLAATGQIFLNLGKYQAIYNAAYVGGFMSYVTILFLTLAGFYIVKNAMERDRKTGVGQILAACSMEKLDYCIGKFLSNFAVLSSMVAVLAAAGAGMYFLHGDKSGFHPATFLAPFIFFALPAMAFTAGIALLFEAIPGLESGLGNIAYFFVWNGILLLGLVTIFTKTPHPFLDLTGGFSLWGSMSAALTSTFPGAEANSFALSVASYPNETIGVFRWNGFVWTAMILLSRFFWVAVALGLTYASAAFFDRFDSARGKAPQAAPEATPVLAEAPPSANNTLAAGGFAPVSLTRVSSRFRFAAVLAAELRLMLKGQRWWWYVVAAGLTIASGVVISPVGRGMVLAFAWIWPVLLWSQMGVRESRDQTSQLLFSTPHPLARQLPAIWLAGFVLAALTGSGFALRLIIGGNARGFTVWLIGALFIPTFALALGIWSGSSKLFEILYVLLWYLGPMHSISQLDFMGAAPVTASTRYPMFYFALTGALAIAALAGRKRQLQT